MALDETASIISQEYVFGRFARFLEYTRELGKYLDNPVSSDPAYFADKGKNLVIDFVILDEVRFKDAIDWAKKKEGNFPDLLFGRYHMNILTNFASPLFKEIPFYGNSPDGLKKAGSELDAVCRTFYTRGRDGPVYHHGRERIEEDAEKAIILTRTVLDLAHGYISKLCFLK